MIVQWDPSDDFRAVGTVNYWRDDSDTQAVQAAYYFPEVAPFGVGAEAIEPFLITKPDNRKADWAPRGYQPSPNTSAPRPAFEKKQRVLFGSSGSQL